LTAGRPLEGAVWKSCPCRCPCPSNALGTVKLVFPNKYDVYLHDTPAHGLFKREQRTFSHGCIRMDRPAEMAACLLGGNEKGWSLAHVNEVIASQIRQVVVLDQANTGLHIVPNGLCESGRPDSSFL
jgi:murein L,D-transpeptidase YcbB/YkuD